MNYTQREKFIDKLCGASLMLIFIEVLYAIVDYSYKSSFNYNNVTTWVYIGAGILLIGAVALLIYAYMKKSGSKACYGAELLVMAFSIAILPGCYIFFPSSIAKIGRLVPYLFALYYIVKIVYIVIHRNDTVSNKSKRK